MRLRSPVAPPPLALQLHHDLDFDRGAFRQAVDGDGSTGVFPCLAKHVHEKVARTVDYRRAVFEAVDRVDEAAHKHDARDLVERADRCLNVRQRVECADLGGFGSARERLRFADLAGVRHLPINHANRARAVEQVSGAHSGHVAGNGSRCAGKCEAE